MTMCVDNTPVEHYSDLCLWVKREDLCCPGGPNFSKTRGVWAHVAARPEQIIGVLDTAHSQGGWAVARACQLLGKTCVNYFPVRKGEESELLEPQQAASWQLGSRLYGLPAGRSAVLYHRAKKHLRDAVGGISYMMPNALKLPEMVYETMREVGRTEWSSYWRTVLVSASSGTIAAGVIAGLAERGWRGKVVVHLGYSRSEPAVRQYVNKMADVPPSVLDYEIVDEGYAYKDEAPATRYPPPPFPCNRFYDLKLYQWWLCEGRDRFGEALMWNIG